MVCWGRLAADVWDGFFAAAISKDAAANDSALILDARIKHWTDVILPTIPLLAPEYPPESLRLRQHTIVQNSLDQLRLMLFRQTMLTSRYDADVAGLCRDLAVNIVQRIKPHLQESVAGQPTSFRFPMASCLGGAMLILATLNFRGTPYIASDDHSRARCEEAYVEATNMLAALASSLPLARRIKDDFAEYEKLHQQTVDPTKLNIGHDDSIGKLELFPFTALDFTQQFGFNPGADTNNTYTNGSSSSTLNTDPWSLGVVAKEGRYGVPWI